MPLSRSGQLGSGTSSMRPGGGPCEWDAAASNKSEFLIVRNVKIKTGNAGNTGCVNLSPRKRHPEKVDWGLAENYEIWGPHLLRICQEKQQSMLNVQCRSSASENKIDISVSYLRWSPRKRPPLHKSSLQRQQPGKNQYNCSEKTCCSGKCTNCPRKSRFHLWLKGNRCLKKGAATVNGPDHLQLKTKNPWDLDGYTYDQWNWNGKWRIDLIEMLTEVCFSKATDSANASEFWFDSWVKFVSAKKYKLSLLCSDLVGLLQGSRVIHSMDCGATLSYVYVYIYIYIHVQVWVVRKFGSLFPDRFRLFTRRGLRFDSTLSYF